MKIDIFTHIVPPKYKTALARVAPHLSDHVGRLPTLYDMDQRFRVMDNCPEVKQVLTMAMTATLIFDDPKSGAEFAKMANDEMAELANKHPDRFAAGVASLAMMDIDDAANELDRAVRDLGLKGIQLFTPVKNRQWNLDDLLPLLKRMSDYNLPIWIHPVRPIDRDDYEMYFMNHVFGWPYESTAAMLHLVLGGIMEKLPQLKVIVHHCGALVPFFAGRMVESYDASRTIHGMESTTRLSRPFIDYFKMFYTDTVLGRGTPGLMCGHAFFGAHHLLFGTDMPYDAEMGNRVIHTIEAVDAMAITDQEKQMIYLDNARALLKL
ncbi:MAG TPA: amidohydrolase family protein [Syntrophorhabdales bacterium]|nr:amidohydrolase family protein [Syntrophorhabdales bacterium]